MEGSFLLPVFLVNNGFMLSNADAKQKWRVGEAP